MKINQKTLPIVIILATILLVAVSISMSFYKKEKTVQELDKQRQNSEIEILKNEVEKLNQQQPPPAVVGDTTGYASIVAEWKNRVAMVTCSWGSSNGQPRVSMGGSALLTTIANYGFVAMTNKHVITDSYGRTADSCSLLLVGPGGLATGHTTTLQFLYGNPFLTTMDGSDRAYIKLSHGLFNIYNDKEGLFSAAAKAKLNICSYTGVSIGDELIVLGFPAIGSENSITVTEGIISGIENDYYVTSAKIDHGNSGGAAILIKDDCYIGIPTWANTGSIESLGRILKTDLFINEANIN